MKTVEVYWLDGKMETIRCFRAYQANNALVIEMGPYDMIRYIPLSSIREWRLLWYE